MKQELLGLKEIEEQVIKCSNCNAPLAEVVLIETNEARKTRNLHIQSCKFRVLDCPKCGCNSFNSGTFDGTTIVGPLVDGYTLEEVETDCESFDDRIEIYSILKMRKNNG